MAVRRVRRVIRKFDPWTVMKVSLVFYAVMALVFVLSMVILWAIIVNAGIPQAIEGFLKKITLLSDDATLFGDGEQYLRIVVFLSVVWTALMTGITTLFAVMYNLISDVVGGVEVIVLEETLSTPPVAAVTSIRAPQPWSSTPAPSAGEDRPTQEIPAVEKSATTS